MEANRPAPSSDKIAKGLFALSALMLAFLYGVGATHYGLFPVPLMKTAKTTIDQLLEESGAALPWYCRSPP